MVSGEEATISAEGYFAAISAIDSNATMGSIDRGVVLRS
jgi:hypothetical protein